ncbi:MAG TPA: ABC transporter permease [Pyrinomonadaceae bacterium]|jgi:predicted permease|nr:ABC transporter permease [Pyrinomonadaceae bacterium]
MRTLWQDVKFGARALRKSPGFTLVAVVSLAVGIGANTTIFSLVNAALLRPLPGVAEESRVVDVNRTTREGDSFSPMSYPDYEYFRDHARAFKGLAAYTFLPVDLTAGGEARRAHGLLISSNYFDVLGARPARGRFFLAEEDRAGAPPAAVISHSLWRDRMGSAEDAVGKQIALNGRQFTIVGIAPEGFKSPFIYLSPDVFVPLHAQSEAMPGRDMLSDRSAGWLGVRGRLNDDSGVEQAGAELNVLAGQLQNEFPDAERGMGASVRPVGHVPGEVRSAVVKFMATLSVVVGLVLLVACANVAGMLLARSAARRREMAIRAAMGATRVRVIRQLLTESLMLFICGGSLGVLLAVWMNDLVLAFRPTGTLSVAFELNVDWRVLAYTLGVSLVTGVVFGLAPALTASKPDLVPALKDTAPTAARTRLRGAFVVGQIAISLVLLVAAALCVQSLRNAARIETGFDPDNVWVASVDLSLQNYEEARGREFFRRLKERVASEPGVEAAAFARSVQLSGLQFNSAVRIEGHEPAAGEPPLNVFTNWVDEDYMRALRVPLLAGRGVAASDDSKAARVVVINETMANRYFGGAADAIGKRFTVTGRPRPGDPTPPADASVEVVGVARDGRYYTLGEEPQSYMYLSAEQDYRGMATLHVRVAPGADAPALVAALRREARSLDPNLPLVNVQPMTEAVGFSLIPLRLAASVVGGLGLVGLLLAALGVYGVVAYAVGARTKEIGIRVALGAQGRDILRLVMRQGFVLVVLGLALGTACAYALTRYLASLLYGVSTSDPLAFSAGAVLLALAALLASYLPARRATKVDPTVALRHE